MRHCDRRLLSNKIGALEAKFNNKIKSLHAQYRTAFYSINSVRHNQKFYIKRKKFGYKIYNDLKTNLSQLRKGLVIMRQMYGVRRFTTGSTKGKFLMHFTPNQISKLKIFLNRDMRWFKLR